LLFLCTLENAIFRTTLILSDSKEISTPSSFLGSREWGMGNGEWGIERMKTSIEMV
jgi:hypothetical protein